MPPSKPAEPEDPKEEEYEIPMDPEDEDYAREAGLPWPPP